MKRLILILGDQLSRSISSLKDADKKNDLIIMCEVKEEATYVRHHKKKIAFLFSAMRHFAKELEKEDFKVAYTTLDAPENSGSFAGEVKRYLAEGDFNKVIVTQPGEYRVLQEMLKWEEETGLPVEIRRDDLFLCSIEEFETWASSRKVMRMEYFYRDMRKKYEILMQEGQPLGGAWNFDSENRKTPPSNLEIPPPYIIEEDDVTRSVLALVEEKFSEHFGDLDPFHFAVTREGALQVLDHFIEYRLPMFGDYQDAMVQGEPWMYHSHISFYLNCGMLLPLECIKAAERAYHAGNAPLNAVEGFIRQILGWREYVRGIYWLKMPEYADVNYLESGNELPGFYWTADTQMNCVRQCVLETKNNAYAHHIQRLMVLGNFALLIGVHPKHLNEWFLIVYADAYEWVELPNVSGMVLFADGGYLASKPYAAGGSYINKMSDYCKSCSYKVTAKNGPKACPFNYLYWDFLNRNREKLKSNHRVGMMYKTYDRMAAEKKTAIAEDSRRFIKQILKTP